MVILSNVLYNVNLILMKHVCNFFAPLILMSKIYTNLPSQAVLGTENLSVIPWIEQACHFNHEQGLLLPMRDKYPDLLPNTHHLDQFLGTS